jgi:hypothetical protein
LRERDHWGVPGVDGKIILQLKSGSGMSVYGLDIVKFFVEQVQGTEQFTVFIAKIAETCRR